MEVYFVVVFLSANYKFLLIYFLYFIFRIRSRFMISDKGFKCWLRT